MGHLAVVLAVAGCRGKGDASLERIAALVPPTQFQDGATVFAAHCGACHGKNATGTGMGPPLVHDYYRPSHHADAAFLLAAQRGVVAHHWRFGNMPPVTGVTPEEVALVTAFVRWLQREAGID